MPKVGKIIEVTNRKDDKAVELLLRPAANNQFSLIARVADAEPGADPLFDALLDREDALAIADEFKKSVEALPPPVAEGSKAESVVDEKPGH